MPEQDPFDFDAVDIPVPKQPSRKRTSKSLDDEIADVAEFGTPESGGGRKKRKTINYNAKVSEILKKKGFPYRRVEFHNAFSGKKVDLFGFADYVFLDQQIVALQVTSQANLSGHLSKIVKNQDILDACKRWIAAGRFEMWGFTKNDKGRFEITQHVITSEMLDHAVKGGRMKWTKE